MAHFPDRLHSRTFKLSSGNKRQHCSTNSQMHFLTRLLLWSHSESRRHPNNRLQNLVRSCMKQAAFTVWQPNFHFASLLLTQSYISLTAYEFVDSVQAGKKCLSRRSCHGEVGELSGNVYYCKKYKQQAECCRSISFPRILRAKHAVGNSAVMAHILTCPTILHRRIHLE